MSKDNKVISYLTNLLLSFWLDWLEFIYILLGQDVGSSLVALIIFWLNFWHKIIFFSEKFGKTIFYLFLPKLPKYYDNGFKK
jgi:hypothetical protein